MTYDPNERMYAADWFLDRIANMIDTKTREDSRAPYDLLELHYHLYRETRTP